MKSLYKSILFVLVILSFTTLTSKVQSQCLVDYTSSNYFCDLDSLYLTAVPVEGTGPFTFLWETGETTQTIIIPLALGDYMLTMTDANGCISIINCHIKPFPDVIYYPFNQNACEGDTVTIWLDWFRDSIPGSTYLWSDGSTGTTLQVTDDIVWSVTITDPATGCTYVIPPNLFDFHPTPTPEIVGPTAICNGQTITLSATGGPFGTLVWYIEGVWEAFYGETFEVTGPGTYYVWGSSPEAGYCWNQDTIVITGGNITPPLLAGPPDLCTGQTGTVSVTNSSQFISFNWSNGQTTPSFTATSSGTFTVTVTNSEGCTATESITIDQNNGASLTSDATGATCGESTGAINLTPSPLQSYDYAWSNGATTQDISNIPPGTYTVTVTDDNGCSSTAIEVVPDIPITIALSGIVTPNNSCSNYNGAVNISVSPPAIYAFNWSNGATTEDIDNLLPGTYTVTVSTGVNCSTSASFVVEDFSGAAEINPIILPTTCGESNGSITIQLDGGIGPFTYVWSNGNTTESLTDVSANTYGVTVTGSDGCISVESIILPNEDPEITISADIIPNTSCSSSNGAIDITVTPADNYSYTWSNGSIAEDIFNLGAGTYTVTVTLGNTCIETETFTVTNENIPFNITGTTINNSSCTVPGGTIDVNITPAGSYSFEWSTGESSEDLSGLNAGTYTVTVTNSTGCSISSSFTIEDVISGITLSGVIIHNTSCDIPNGMIDINVEPAGSYTYSWDTGATSEDLQNVSGGSYQVTVTNTDGCSATSTFTIENQSAGFSITGTPINNTSCTNPNGSIDLTINPAGAYTYSWSNGTTTEDLQLVNEGVFSVTVTDGNGCSASASFTIAGSIELPVINASIANEICGDANGSIDLTVSTLGNSFLWNTGATSEDLSGLQSGSYIVTVTTSSGCQEIDTFTIANTSNTFTLNGNVVDNTSCSSANGSVDLIVTPAGTYTYLWSTGQTIEDLQNLDAGTYIVTVTDAMNCISTASFNIQSTTLAPEVTSTVSPATCGQANGGIQLVVNPASGNTFIWSNGSFTKDLSNISAGSYGVTVTSSNGCTTSASIVVPDNTSNFSFAATTTDNNSCASSNGAIDLNITPSGSYTFNWSNGATTEDLQGLAAGVYVVTVTDAFACSSTGSFTVIDHINLPEVTASVSPATCGQNNGEIMIAVANTTNNSFVWSDGSTSKDRINLLPGTYQLTVTAGNGCSSTIQIEVPNQNTNFALTSIVNDDSSCSAPSGTIDLTITPTGNYSFAWSNGSTTEDLLNVPSGIYEVTVTDEFNCSSVELFIIENISVTPLLAQTITSSTCGNANGKIDLTVSPVTGNSFIWSTGATTEDIENLSPGTYSVTVTTSEGCVVEGQFNIDGSAPLELTLDADLSVIHQGETVTCSLQLNVPLAMIDSIMWSPDQSMSCHAQLCLEQSFTITEQMNISVMAVDTNGCYGIAQLQLDIERDFKIYIPNVFTPNSDDANERFTVYTNEEIQHVELLQIFDRWGNLVFVNETFPPSKPEFGWDGIFSGKMMNPAVYAYRAVVTDKKGGQHFFKGDVTLVR